ncbi:hypothetical protein B0E50_07455 [Rhodanobacter sp. C01]|nr:hypothetical protein B0E50_07455 [Rhodanobacter sp. C01]
MVGELGIHRVKGSYLLPIIFGDMSSAGLYIGSFDEMAITDTGDPALSYQSYRLPSSLGGGEIAVIIMRLLPHMKENPAYIVLCDLHEKHNDII